MPSVGDSSSDDTFFNDLSQQAPTANANRDSPTRVDAVEGNKDDANKPKRIACVLCRKRKLRCDGNKPTCGTCKRLAHDCAYDEVRKKSGPKRGYVKLLEARLQQVETLLKNQESTEQNKDAPPHDTTSAYVANTLKRGPAITGDTAPVAFQESALPGHDGYQTSASANAHAAQGEFPWEMIGLGLDEPLPPQDVMNDLYQIYFTKIHPSLPIIHRPRFLAAMNLAPHMRPPVCLRYIMWALAASVSDKYDGLQQHFYERARKYAQIDEMRGYGEATITLAHCQTWGLMSTYEFKLMYFPRAWLSAGRAVRLAQMMQLHRLDGVGLDVKQCLPPPKDWTEREERRRTFWYSFCVDRYASIGTGWPMMYEEQDILTNLPSSEEAFEKSKAMATSTLDEALQPGGAAKLEAFGGIIVTAALFGRNLLHLHRPGPDDCDEDLNGGFWTRHREIESILLNTALSLPDHLRLPTGLPDTNAIFLNMSLHTSAICLHQAAIFKADKYRLDIAVSNESKVRCVTAAAEIASIMRMISHMDLSAMNPFISFCVYVAARVFVQYLKNRPKDQQMNSSLQFLLQAMQALRRRNPLTESFLVQLDIDLETAGLLTPDLRRFMAKSTAQAISKSFGPQDSSGCMSVFVENLGVESTSTAAVLTGFAEGFTDGTTTAQDSVTQRSGNTPGPPFYAASTQISAETQTANPFVPSQATKHVNLTSRRREQNTFSSTSFALPDENEMDISADDEPSPATTNSQSRGGSTSHTSYSSGNQNDMHDMQYRNSAKDLSGQIPLPHTTAGGPTANFFSTSDDMFPTGMYNTGAPVNGDISSGFLLGNEWDMSGMASGTAGMTPMSEGSWNQMIDGINLGWDSIGPPHGGGRHG